MNRRTLLSRLGAVVGFSAVAPLLRFLPVKSEPRPRHFPATSTGKPFCGTTESNPIMCNPNGGIIDCPSCVTKLSRKCCARADRHIVHEDKPHDYYEVVHLYNDGTEERICHLRKVWRGDGRFSDKAAQKAWDAGEIVYWPNGSKVKATDWNSPTKAV